MKISRPENLLGDSIFPDFALLFIISDIAYNAVTIASCGR